MYLVILDFDKKITKITICPFDVEDFNLYISEYYNIKNFKYLICDDLHINI